MDCIGEDKICLGTDYPFPLGELEPGKLIKEHKCSDKQKSKMLFGSALSWLGLKEERFLKNKI